MGMARVQDHLLPGLATDREEDSVIEKSLSPAPPRAPGDDQGQHSARNLLNALTAVREALDIPHAATEGDEEVRAKIMEQRVMHTMLFLRGILDRDRRSYRSAEDDVAYLRDRLAEHPAEGYKTWDESMAELEAAKGGDR
jgi:hypothetical protein